MDHFHIHIDMILSTLGLSPQGFVFGFFPQNILYQFDAIHTYMLISLRAYPQIGISLTTFEHTPYVKHHLPKSLPSPHQFVRLPFTVKLEPGFGTTYWETFMDYFPIHISVILSILGLSSHDFVFGLFIQKTSYQFDVIHAYILISLRASP